MVSRLLPETLSVLRAQRPCEPFFSNAMAAEAFEAAHSLGPFKVLRTVTRCFAVVDTRRHFADQTVATEELLERADATMFRLAVREGLLRASSLAAVDALAMQAGRRAR